MKRIHREGEKVRLRPENSDYEELVLKAGDARVQRRVVYVVQPPEGRGAGGLS